MKLLLYIIEFEIQVTVNGYGDNVFPQLIKLAEVQLDDQQKENLVDVSYASLGECTASSKNVCKFTVTIDTEVQPNGIVAGNYKVKYKIADSEEKTSNAISVVLQSVEFAIPTGKTVVQGDTSFEISILKELLWR